MEKKPIGWGSSTFGVDQGGQCPPQIPLSTFPIGKPPTMAENKLRIEMEERTKELEMGIEEKEMPKPVKIHYSILN